MASRIAAESHLATPRVTPWIEIKIIRDLRQGVDSCISELLLKVTTARLTLNPRAAMKKFL